MAELLAEKVVQPAAIPKQLAYCPAMDLIALATVDQRVRVYRLNGQEGFSVTSKPDDGEIRAIKWKPDGTYFRCSVYPQC